MNPDWPMRGPPRPHRGETGHGIRLGSKRRGLIVGAIGVGEPNTRLHKDI